mgnify:FL=1
MKMVLIVSFILLSSQKVFSNDFLIKKKSSYSVKITLDRFVNSAKKKGLTIFSRIDHQVNASKLNLKMHEEEVIIFGNPKIGTALMIENPLVGLELPLKMMAYSDKKGQVRSGYLT